MVDGGADSRFASTMPVATEPLRFETEPPARWLFKPLNLSILFSKSSESSSSSSAIFPSFLGSIISHYTSLAYVSGLRFGAISNSITIEDTFKIGAAPDRFGCETTWLEGYTDFDLSP